jgi:hypothetical protein
VAGIGSSPQGPTVKSAQVPSLLPKRLDNGQPECARLDQIEGVGNSISSTSGYDAAPVNSHNPVNKKYHELGLDKKDD